MVSMQDPQTPAHQKYHPQGKEDKKQFANKSFPLVTALPMMERMDYFQETLPLETRKCDSGRCG